MLKSEKLTVQNNIKFYLTPTILLFPLADWFWGNSTSLVFMFYCLLLRGLYYQQSPIFLGLLFSGLMIKPHFFIPLGLLLTIEFFRLNKISFCAGIVGGFLIQFLPVAILVPNIAKTYINALPEITSASTQFGGISLYSAFKPDFGLNNPVSVLLVLLLIPGVILAFNRACLCKRALMIMPLSVAIAPHAQAHSLLLIAPMYFYLFAKYLDHRRISLLLMHTLLMSVLFSAIYLSPLFMTFAALLILVLAVVGVYLLREERETKMAQ